ncbi:MAG: WS/DGAT/MGAT family O-acyltransferase [Burkholderiaceae bacterium]
MGRERMSPVDTAWLRMDSPVNLMMIVGVHVFESPIDYATLRDVVGSRLLMYRRFKQKVVQDASGAWWVDDVHFDLDAHLQRISLPGDGSKRELEKLVASLSADSLDFGKPLWQFSLVENYQGGQALIVRIHHCIADGIALIGVMFSMTAPTPEGSLATPEKPSWIKTRTSSDNANVWEDFFAPVTKTAVRALNSAGGAAASAIEQAGAVLQEPELAAQHAAQQAGEFAHIAGQVAKDAAKIALMPADSPTALKGKPGRAKMVAWNEPLPLHEIKNVGKALGCSVNDVLLSCVAGALRSYLVSIDEEVPYDTEIRAMVPVNLRPRGKEHQLGNKFGLVPLTLPVGIANPLARLYEVRRRMTELKGGYQAIFAMGVLGVVGNFPKTVQNAVLSLFTSKATAVMTNVPGPSEPLYMAGSKMKQIMFWVPQSGDIGLGVSILSYAGGVQFGVITSKKLCPEPQRIIDRFASEFEKLIMAAMLSGPDYCTDPQEVEYNLFPELRPKLMKAVPSKAGKAVAAKRVAAAAANAAEKTLGKAPLPVKQSKFAAMRKQAA